MFLNISNLISVVYVLLFCFVTIGLSGCGLFHLRKETATLYNSTILVGHINCEGIAVGSPLVVAARSAAGRERIITHYTVLHEPGPYELIVPQGQWQIIAFADTNSDLTWQPEESVGLYREGPIHIDQAGGVVQDVNIVVRERRQRDLDLPENVTMTTDKPANIHYTSSGIVRALSDPLFNEDNGVKGFWRPLEFFREYGGTISFLQPFDPKKIPVLFVHGATGTPAGWQYLINHIDLNRYQPWFYFYPSGASIKSMADLLFWKLINLKSRYHVKEMHLVAHSMGGLVERSFLVDYGHLFPAIRTFISLSTPWSGDELVENGLRYSPGVIPAWRDMDPNGEFALSIYRKKLPPGIAHYLLFGHRGNRNPLRPNNDGVVTLATQLDPRAQAEAKMVFGFEEDHSSILESERVASVLNNILAREDGARATVIDKETGTLKMSFSPVQTNNWDIWPEIQILPRNRNQADGYFFRLNLLQSDQPLGPFPTGVYEVRVMVNGFKISPARQEVTIGANLQPKLHVDLTPSGTVSGMVHRRFYQDADPAGVYMPFSHKVSVSSIHLSGTEVERQLVPLQDGDFDNFQQYQAGKDWAYQNGFSFYNLPQGDYTLTIQVDGQPPYSEQRRVEPGRPIPSHNIILPQEQRSKF